MYSFSTYGDYQWYYIKNDVFLDMISSFYIHQVHHSSYFWELTKN